jgi:Porin subfamily
MNIKSLLLGSAAALAAVSGARAADAVVVAEPEPVEYVRVCDVYGAGFYYIPGTETCLRVGGYLRYDVRAGDAGTGYGGLNDVQDRRDPSKTNDTYFSRARAAVQLDARSETELGTLRGYMHVDFNWNTVVNGANNTDTDQGIGIEHAFIELGGFRVGKTDSLFATLTGYAGNVIADDMIPYAAGAYDTTQIVYNYVAGNGFSASVGVEQGSFENTIDSYVPHVVAGAAYTQGWGGVSGVVGYDSNYQEWAGKLRLDVNATEQLSLFVMAGYGSEKNAPVSFYKGWNGKWAAWGGATYKLNEKLAANLQVSYAQGSDKYVDDKGNTFAQETGVAANVAYTLVPGLTITPEVDYKRVRFHDVNGDRQHENAWSGMVRFQRSF